MINPVHKSTPIYAEMQRRLADVRSRYYIEQAARGSLLSIGAALGLAACLCAIEVFIEGSTLFRTVLFMAGSAAILLLTGWLTVMPLLRWKKILRGISEKEVALRVGEKFPYVKDRLWNILNIFEENNTPENETHSFHPDYSPDLIDASFADLQQAAALLRFTDVVSLDRKSVV
jgi:hypothetical protein